MNGRLGSPFATSQELSGGVEYYSGIHRNSDRLTAYLTVRTSPSGVPSPTNRMPHFSMTRIDPARSGSGPNSLSKTRWRAGVV
jgi:hypothetical protein